MFGRDGEDRLLDPVFSLTQDALIIGFPTTNSVYSLFDGEGGHFGRPNSADNEGLTWSFETSNSFSAYTEYGVNETYGLYNVIAQYPMVRIRVTWTDGRATIFYKDRNGQWRITSRDEAAFSRIYPTFSNEYNSVNITFQSGSSAYTLFNDGTGRHDNEHFTWHFDYSSH